MRQLVILGSTGSIGRQALEVLPAVPGLRLVGLAAGRGAAGVVEQARAHGVRDVCLHDADAAAQAAALAPELAVHAGEAGIRELIAAAAERAAAEGTPLTVLNGVVGAAGLRATMATLEAGATLALANKESMVAGGPFERPDTGTFRCLALAEAAGTRAMLAEREAAATGAGPRTVAAPIVGVGGDRARRGSGAALDAHVAVPGPRHDQHHRRRRHRPVPDALLPAARARAHPARAGGR